LKGKLYGVGVGPGDPELITIKAKRIMESAQCIAVPKTSEGKESLALSIARDTVRMNGEIMELVFPMTPDAAILAASWDNAANAICRKLDGGLDVAFLTLGDPTVYSTYAYIHNAVEKMGYEALIIPGIPSFCACAARAGVSLGENNEKIAVIPYAYEPDVLSEVMEKFDSVVLMKVSGNLEKVREILAVKWPGAEIALVSRCGLPGERIYRSLGQVGDGETGYFSTMIIKKGGAA